MGQYFAQVTLAYQSFNIKKPSQMCNLCGTVFTPRRDLGYTRLHRVITTSANCVAYPRSHLKYCHHIAILVSSFAIGLSVAADVLFRREREPRHSDEASRKKVSEVVTSSWTPFWRKHVASVNTAISQRWVKIFIRRVCRAVEMNKGIVLFYDGQRAHMPSEVIGALFKHRIAVIAHPDHISDHLQPLNVSQFGPLQQYIIARTQEHSAVARALEYHKRVDA